MNGTAPVPVTVILHAFAWPEASTLDGLRGRLRDAFGGELEILEAREDPAAAIGAAALINAAARRASGRVLLVLEPSTLPTVDSLRALAAAAADGVALERVRSEAPRESHDARSIDPLAALESALERDDDDSNQREPAWAVAHETFDALGGLDDRLWSVGLADDLRARACLAGVAARELELDANPQRIGPDAYPLRAPVAELLRLRNPLLTALKTRPPERLGLQFAQATARAIGRAWQATGLPDATFQFGGTWGRNHSAFQRLARGAAGRPRLPVDLRDADGCLLPLLAIDSALDEADATVAQRSPLAEAEVEVEAEIVEASPAIVPQTADPFVSVIVVNWNGAQHLRDCFGSLSQSDYPADRFELICVDNGSADNSRELLQNEFPRVKVVALDRNRGFTGGNEAGVAAARPDAEVFVFLNNDMRIEPDCLRELVHAMQGGEHSDCVGARVLSWDGRYIDFIRGSLNFEARGFQDFYGLRNRPELSTPTDTFFPNGGAFAVTRAAYTRAGGFDPAFFAYYDDVDLGWRLRLTGATIRVAGRAVVYHRHGATSRTQPKGQKRFLMERNALWTLMKNYSDRALRRTLGIVLSLAVRRLLDETDIDRNAPLARTLAPFARRCRRRGESTWAASLLYQVNEEKAEATRPALRAMPLESLGAMATALAALPRVRQDRAAVQAARVVPDKEILPRFGRNLEAVSALGSYKQLQRTLLEAHDLAELFRARTRLLIIGHEAIATNMSGPAVRVLEIGRALASIVRVTIATPALVTIEDPHVTFASYDRNNPAGLKRLAEDADVLLIQGFTLVQYPFLESLHIPIIVDLYCPFTIEHLEQTRARLAAAGPDPSGEKFAAIQQEAAGVLGVQNHQLRVGDFFLCASEAQRDFWIGALHSHGRLNPLTYADDPTLRRLIDVVPFGLPEETAIAAAARAAEFDTTRPVMKGVRPGIGPNDRVLLWAGSMLDWQDPLTLIRAVGDIARTRNDVKLLFMGTKHPNPAVSPMRVVDDSRALAQQLGLLDTHVFFNDWVPYDQRARYLVEADIGVSTHLDHLETHFSFRTRMLDYIWAGLPIVCTRGDFFASLVDARGLGATVAPGDPAALAHTLARLLDDSAERFQIRSRVESLQHELRWSIVVAPLARYCAQPSFAADRGPAMRAFRDRLERQYGGAKWLKRTALRFGLSEYRIERLKQSSLGQAAMAAQTRLALRRARRP
jgi:GT2 family glycosyltransferase/glycosyltransferase involved in cell wall biosynthesis